jgi:hypothetical protein
MLTYKKRIANHIDSLYNRGLTRDEIAKLLGFEKANVVSMHADPANPISPFPLTRLPALDKACRLSAIECVELVWARAKDYPNGSTCMDTATVRWVMQRTVRASSAVKMRKAEAIEDKHGV